MISRRTTTLLKISAATAATLIALGTGRPPAAASSNEILALR